MISPRSLQNYVMPYAMTALFDEKMLKVNQKNMDLKQKKNHSAEAETKSTMMLMLQHENMTSASVEVVGAVCRKLTWSKYLYYLKHFVHVLQTSQAEQKLGVT